MDIVLSRFNLDSGYGVMPLNLGYLNSSAKKAGYESSIKLFEEIEVDCLDLLYSMDLYGNSYHSWNTIRHPERLEVISSSILAEQWGLSSSNYFHENFKSGCEGLERNYAMIAKELAAYPIVGLTVLPSAFPSILRICQLIKDYDRDCTLVMGGPTIDVINWFFDGKKPFFEGLKNEVVKKDKLGILKRMISDSVDFLVHSEGEQSLVGLLDALKSNRPLKEVSGISFFKNAELHKTSERPILPMDDLVWPDFDGVDEKYYHAISFSTSRGCPHGCKFCDERIFWGKFRYRDPSLIADEMESQLSHYNIRYFFAGESLLNGNAPQLERLCHEIIERKLNIKWGGNMRLNGLNRPLIDLLYESGFRKPRFGLESLDSDTLSDYSKNQDVKKSIETLKYTSDLGMTNIVYFMIGYPKKNFNEELSTVKKMVSIKKYIGALSLDAIDIRLRNCISMSPGEFGFEFKANADFDQECFDGHSLLRSYIPGTYLYVKNGRTREEVDALVEEYIKNGLGYGPEIFEYRIGVDLKKLKKLIPFRNQMRKLFVKSTLNI